MQDENKKKVYGRYRLDIKRMYSKQKSGGITKPLLKTPSNAPVRKTPRGPYKKHMKIMLKHMLKP
jgi:hypothetical protein